MRICQDRFAVVFLLNVECHLEIAADDKIKRFPVVRGRSYPLTINATYILGTDYDVDHENFGFSSEYPSDSDSLRILQNGVTISNEAFNPTSPDVSESPNSVQVFVYSATLTFPNNEAAFNDLVRLMTSNGIKINPQILGVLAYNQGV